MSTSSSFTNTHSAGASFLNAHDEVPYDADEIAEDCRWHELQSNGTPYKDDLRGTLPGALETTPGAAKPNEFVANTEISPVKIIRLGNEEEAWPWRRENVVDTWNSILNTPQRPESLPNASGMLGSSQPDAPHSYLQSIHQTTASAWSTDQEDNDHEDVDPSSQFLHHSQHQHHPQSHHQHSGSFGSFNPSGMARLSLSEESESYGNTNAMSHQQTQLSQQLQGRPRQPHMMSQQQQQQMPQQTYINNPQQQQGYTHSTHQYAQQQQLQQQQQPQQQQMRSGMHSDYMGQTQGHLMHQQSQQSQQQQGVRYPSPPPSSQSTTGPVNVRSIVSQPPGHAWMNSGSASAQMAIPAPVLRTNQFQSSSAFAHSTSGPVRGMPTNQVNYNQQHQIHQQQQQTSGQMYPRGQGAHSQPLTPVGSFVNTSAPGNYQSHSHPASPRGAQSHAGDPHTTSTLSSFVGTPNLSPLSSPIISPHASPSRYTNKTQSQPQQQTTQSFMPQQQQQQQPSQQHPHLTMMSMHVRSNSSNISSLSSSGASTPTSQVGPPFHAQAQAVFNYQQNNMMMQPQQQQPQQQQVQQVQVQVSQNYGPPPSYHSMSAASNANMGSNMSMMQQPYVQQSMQSSQGMNPQSSPQRRPLVIQTGSQMLQGHYVSVPQQHAAQHINMPHPASQQGGTLLIKPNMPSIINVHPSASTTPTNSQAPILSGDSPTSKSRFKIFYRDLWALVRETDTAGGSVGAEKAYEYGLGALKQPEHERIAWKIAMELADLAKRQNHIPRARFWYQRAHTLEPLASQVWIEHAKMEEECGELLECERLMEEGLKHCEGNEALMIKALKHHERMGDLAAARSILAKLKDSPLDKVWRTVLEGGLMEARMGQMTVARRVFKYLLSHVNWMGPIYSEYARVEERWAHFDAALAVVEKGLIQVPRYGPLWFMAFRLHERTCNGDYDVARLHAQRALSHVSTELVWKMHFELAQMEERLGEFERARDSYAASIHHCPMNLRWKIWLSGARMELLSGDPARIPVVRALLNRANDEVPRKMKCMVSLELSRMEEFLGNLNEARRILKIAQKESKGEWKVFLESVLLELRAGNIDAAIAEAESALEIHNGTGRLWAILIQLKQKQKHALGHRIGHTNGSMKSQWAIFKLAIREVPKSGEVWCEGARLVLNPYAPRYFNLKAAKRFLNFAIQFTPQYGDSFIEYLRLKMILEGITEMSTQPLNSAAQPQQPSQLYTAANAAAGTDAANQPPLSFQGSGRSTPTDSSLSASNQSHFRRVQQLCVNAEPNYGSSWFACKPHPLWSPVEVLDVARGMIETHLIKNQSQYQTAILRNWYAEQSAGSRSPSVHEMEIENLHPAEAGEIAPFSPQVLQRMRSHSRSSSIRSASDESVPEQLEFAPLSPSLSSRMSEASVEAETTIVAPSAEVEMEEVTNAVSSLASLQVDSQAENVRSALSAQQFSPTTLRLAREVENGRCMVLDNDSQPCSSRSTTPDSMSSQLLTSEDDEDDLQAEYQADAEFNSLQILYPPIANLSVADKHRCLYGADPITP